MGADQSISIVAAQHSTHSQRYVYASGDYIHDKLCIAFWTLVNTAKQICLMQYATSLCMQRIMRLIMMEQDGYTALMWAAHFGHAMVVSLLVDKGANIDVSSKVESSSK